MTVKRRNVIRPGTQLPRRTAKTDIHDGYQDICAHDSAFNMLHISWPATCCTLITCKSWRLAMSFPSRTRYRPSFSSDAASFSSEPLARPAKRRRGDSLTPGGLICDSDTPVTPTRGDLTRQLGKFDTWNKGRSVAPHETAAGWHESAVRIALLIHTGSLRKRARPCAVSCIVFCGLHRGSGVVPS